MFLVGLRGYVQSFTLNFKQRVAHVENLQRINNKIINVSKLYDEKLKDTIFGKWIRYWKQVYNDYRDVAIEVQKENSRRPLKTVGILSTFSILCAFAKTNPDEVSFRDALLSATNDVILVNPTLQRQSSVEHLRILEKCYNRKLIRRQSFLFFSVMWVDNYNCDCSKFECQCSYLQVSYIEFFKRIIDIGFMNKWWLLEQHLEDYDVNY